MLKRENILKDIFKKMYFITSIFYSGIYFFNFRLRLLRELNGLDHICQKQP